MCFKRKASRFDWWAAFFCFFQMPEIRLSSLDEQASSEIAATISRVDETVQQNDLNLIDLQRLF